MRSVLVLVLVLLLGGCKEKVVEKVVEKAVPTVERDLITAVCLLTLMPPSHATGYSNTGVLETAEGLRRPWIQRDYQNVKPEELEANMRWMKDDGGMLGGMLPSSFCKLNGPAYATIRLGPPGGPTQVWSGNIGKLQKVEVPGVLGAESQQRGVELVLAAIKADNGASPRVVFFDERVGVKAPSMSGSWADAFRRAGAK